MKLRCSHGALSPCDAKAAIKLRSHPPSLSFGVAKQGGAVTDRLKIFVFCINTALL